MTKAEEDLIIAEQNKSRDETLKEMKKYNFHTISDNDTEGKMCATCDYGTCLADGKPAYCYKTGLKIDWDFICNQYRELVK